MPHPAPDASARHTPPPFGDPAFPEEPEGDGLRQILHWLSVARRRPLVPLVIALVGAAALAVSESRAPDVYHADGLVQLGLPAGMNMDPGEYVMWVAGRERIMRTQERLLTSNTVVESALRSLGREIPTGMGRRAALGEFLGGVRVTPIEDTFLVTVSATHTDPEEAALRVNALMDAFVPFTNQFLVSRYVIMERQLSEDEERLRKRLANVEAALQEFYSESGNVQFEQRRLSQHERKQVLDRRYTTMRVELVSMEAEREMLERALEGSVGDSTLELLLGRLNDGLFQGRLEPLTKLRSELLAQETELRPDHPTVLLLRQQIKAQEADLRQVAAIALSNQRMREDVAVRETEKLQKLLTEVEDEIRQLERLDGLHRTRKREVDRVERELSVTRERHLRAESRSQMDTGTTLVLSRAERPQYPLPSNAGRNVFLAFLLSLGLGVALVIAYEAFEGTVSSEEDARRWGVPIFGRIPKVSQEEGDQVVLQGGRSVAAEAFRNVRTQLAASRGDDPPAVLVTSAAPGIGKTFVSVNLASALAHAGVRTLLVDGDMRKPRLQKVLGTTHETGLSTILTRKATLADAVHPTELEGLDFLASGPRPSNSSDLLAGSGFATFLAEAAARYDEIIIDTPPVDVVSDAGLMARDVHRVVLVVRLHRSRQRAIGRAVEQLAAVGGRVVGLVLNGMTRMDDDYRYGSGYRYAYYADGGDPPPGSL